MQTNLLGTDQILFVGGGEAMSLSYAVSMVERSYLASRDAGWNSGGNLSLAEASESEWVVRSTLLSDLCWRDINELSERRPRDANSSVP